MRRETFIVVLPPTRAAWSGALLRSFPLLGIHPRSPTHKAHSHYWPGTCRAHSISFFFCCWLLPSASSGSSDELLWEVAGRSQERITRRMGAKERTVAPARLPAVSPYLVGSTREMTREREFRCIHLSIYAHCSPSDSNWSCMRTIFLINYFYLFYLFLKEV